VGASAGLPGSCSLLEKDVQRLPDYSRRPISEYDIRVIIEDEHTNKHNNVRKLLRLYHSVQLLLGSFQGRSKSKFSIHWLFTAQLPTVGSPIPVDYLAFRASAMAAVTAATIR
jgi:hypothetical protein